MTILLECREWLKLMYSRYSLYVRAAIRFVVSLVVFMLITYRMGYMSRLKNPVVPLLLALVCTFLPAGLIVVIAMLLLLAHLYALSMEIAIGMLVIFLILYLLYYRFAPSYSLVLLLTPVAFVLKIPYVMPIALGLVGTPATAVPLSVGCVLYYLLHYVAQYGMNAASAAGTTASKMQQYVYVFENAIKDSGLYLYLVTFLVVLVAVYLIRRMSVDNAWVIAILTGAIGELVFVLVGDFALDISISIVWLIVGTLIAVLLALVLQFFIFQVDYSRTEHVQFEDDEYYYYVKAVPKVSITKREKTVKRINAQKRGRMGDAHVTGSINLDD